MNEQEYPFMISIYKGEGRILIVPLIKHIGSYRIESSWSIRMENMEDCAGIGENILKALDFIRNSPRSTLTRKEFRSDTAWRKNTKYKSQSSFRNNNNFIRFMLFEDGDYTVDAWEKPKKTRGEYGDVINSIGLQPNASTEEIGKAILDLFAAAEEYEKQKPKYDPYPPKSLELLDNSELTIKPPADSHFEDMDDYGVGEIYQCYSYLPNEDSESSAEFFVGIAPEINCNLDWDNIRESWQRVYGKVDFMEIKEVEHGIFKLRAEMRNKSAHKISYFLWQEEDLILECGMDVHQPNRRKKLDEKLSGLFEEFSLGCKK